MWNLTDHGDSVILDENANVISYRTLNKEMLILAEKIRNSNHRCLIFCYCTNTIGSLLGYITFISNRIVPLMLEVQYNETLRNTLIEIYRPDYLWLPRYASEGLSEGFECVYETRGYMLVRTPCERSVELNGQLALLLATSGSTGSPKLVRQSYQNIKSNTEAIVKYLGMEMSDRAITTLPMSYTYGLSIINTHLYIGASVIVTSKTLVQRGFWDLLLRAEATNFGGVPYTYEVLDKLDFFRMDLPSLRYFTQAGGKLKKELCLKYAEEGRGQGKDFIVMYGASEATARMSYLPADMAVEKAGSIGVPIPGGRFELIGSDGSLITGTDTAGELVYYGDNVCMGYAEQCLDLAKGDEWNARLETGDLAERDPDGFYYIVGRKSRFLKLFGKRVNLSHIEELLEQKGYPAVCLGDDDHMRVYTTERDTAAVKNCVCSLTEINRAAFKVFHINEIPRNDAGKVRYSEIE